MAESRRNIVLSVAVGLVIALSVGLGLYYYIPSNPLRSASTASTPSTSPTISQISTSSSFSSLTSSSVTSVLQSTTVTESWTSTFQSGLNPPINETFAIATNGTLLVYVRYYYYNSTAEIFNFSAGNRVSIQGLKGQSTFNANSSFSAISNQTSPVQMGGPMNLSEGLSVMYSFRLLNELNGTYTFSFGWLYSSLQSCAGDFQLQVGNGIPNYGFFGSCTAPLSNFYPVNSQGFVDGYLFAEIEEGSTN